MAARAWQRMLSGRRLDLLDPSPLDVEIEDIAHGLAFVARWNGQTRGEHPYSVAEHSLLVEELYGRIAPRAEPRWRLAALLHDAPEYVIGDMISPVKGAVGPGLRRARRPAGARRCTSASACRPSCPPPVKAQIKRADRISAWLEAVQHRRLRRGRGRPLLRRAAARRLARSRCGCARRPRRSRLPAATPRCWSACDAPQR